MHERVVDANVVGGTLHARAGPVDDACLPECVAEVSVPCLYAVAPCSADAAAVGHALACGQRARILRAGRAEQPARAEVPGSALLARVDRRRGHPPGVARTVRSFGGTWRRVAVHAAGLRRREPARTVVVCRTLGAVSQSPVEPGDARTVGEVAAGRAREREGRALETGTCACGRHVSPGGACCAGDTLRVLEGEQVRDVQRLRVPGQAQRAVGVVAAFGACATLAHVRPSHGAGGGHCMREGCAPLARSRVDARIRPRVQGAGKLHAVARAEVSCRAWAACEGSGGCVLVEPWRADTVVHVSGPVASVARVARARCAAQGMPAGVGHFLPGAGGAQGAGAGAHGQSVASIRTLLTCVSGGGRRRG